MTSAPPSAGSLIDMYCALIEVMEGMENTHNFTNMNTVTGSIRGYQPPNTVCGLLNQHDIATYLVKHAHFGAEVVQVQKVGGFSYCHCSPWARYLTQLPELQ